MAGRSRHLAGPSRNAAGISADNRPCYGRAAYVREALALTVDRAASERAAAVAGWVAGQLRTVET